MSLFCFILYYFTLDIFTLPGSLACHSNVFISMLSMATSLPCVIGTSMFLLLIQ